MENNQSPSSPKILEWKNLRSPQFKELDRDKTVVIITCSPLEVHGPHLPMVTDILEGESLIQRAIELFHPKQPDLTYVRLPSLFVATDVVPQAGSIWFRPSTVVQVLRDMGRSLARQGFKHIWLSNFHGGPRHFVSLEMASNAVNRRYKTRMISIFSMLIRRLTGGKNDLTEVLGGLEGMKHEYLEGDMHGGFVETSMMLHLLADYVDKNHADLPKVTVDTWLQSQGKDPVHEDVTSLPKMIRGFSANLKFYEKETYCGSPGPATAEFGKMILDTLAGLTAEALDEFWKGQISLKECHTPLWPIRKILTSPLINWFFTKMVRHKSDVW